MKMDSIKSPEAFSSWLNTTVSYISMKKLRDTKGKEDLSLDDEDFHYEAAAPDSVTPDKVMDKKGTEEILSGMIDQLSDAQKQTVLMYYYDELSVKEIAESLGVTENTVKSRLRYARANIKTAVEAEEKRGVKLYSVSPLMFMAALRKLIYAASEADGSRAAVLGKLSSLPVLSSAGKAAAAAAADAAGASAAKAAASVGAGVLKGKKLAALICAGVIALGSAAAVAVNNSHSPQPSPVPVETVSPSPSPSPELSEKCEHNWEIQVVHHDAVYTDVHHQEEGDVPREIYVEDFPGVYSGWRAHYYCPACGSEMKGREYPEKESCDYEAQLFIDRHNWNDCSACGGIVSDADGYPLRDPAGGYQRENPGAGNAQYLGSEKDVYAEPIPAHYGTIIETGTREWDQKEKTKPAWDELFVVCSKCGEKHPLSQCKEPCRGEHKWVEKTVRHEAVMGYVHRSESVPIECENWVDDQSITTEYGGWVCGYQCPVCGDSFSTTRTFIDDAKNEAEHYCRNHNIRGCGEFLCDENGDPVLDEHGNNVYANAGNGSAYVTECYPAGVNSTLIPGHYETGTGYILKEWDELVELQAPWEEKIYICSVCGMRKPEGSAVQKPVQ